MRSSKWSNWAGTYTCTPSHFVKVHSELEILQVLIYILVGTDIFIVLSDHQAGILAEKENTGSRIRSFALRHRLHCGYYAGYLRFQQNSQCRFKVQSCHCTSRNCSP